MDELLKSIKTGQPSALYKLWSRTKRQLLRPYRPFQALSLDALDHLVKPDIRTHHNLPLP
ncbi:Hypothetical protein CAP_6291 [Chondromyces apiculatus DSM 436]|uniref:Uncharacterized protein n=1 Tax=Chondromyces apiculatus DSM 436 TaxID=1192034 RepID=A0A017T1F0_9BACT|nr:Hypothetical protein CAP_6291 [Chondromyces apiculatus DSM 436]